jgi:single-strand DNA-binding protein
MNTLKNTVSLIGNLGKDPELTTLASGGKLAKFSIATNESYKDKNGQWANTTQWHNVVAWGKTAELVNQVLKKGSEVVLEGKLENDAYTDKEGTKRYITQINLREFMLIRKDEQKK